MSIHVWSIVYLVPRVYMSCHLLASYASVVFDIAFLRVPGFLLASMLCACLFLQLCVACSSFNCLVDMLFFFFSSIFQVHSSLMVDVFLVILLGLSLSSLVLSLSMSCTFCIFFFF